MNPKQTKDRIKKLKNYDYILKEWSTTENNLLEKGKPTIILTWKKKIMAAEQNQVHNGKFTGTH